MKNEKFRELLSEYVDEISNPENRAVSIWVSGDNPLIRKANMDISRVKSTRTRFKRPLLIALSPDHFRIFNVTRRKMGGPGI